VSELNDIINDLPEGLMADESTEDNEEVDTSAEGDESVDDSDTSDDSEENNEEQEDESEEDAEDDYFTSDDEEENKPTPTVAAQPEVTDEGQYILTNLSKISVNLVVPTADGKGEEVKQFQVYGWGDLPRNYKNFVSPYEQGLFTSSAQNNETRARELQNEFRQNKVKADTEVYIQRENKMIAEDLTELRQEGIFPKFKGIPGSKEFNNSDGAKEFDKVVAYMNEQNDRYGKAANSGKAFRHIGFREAFIMLNGPNIKANEKRDMDARRRVAGKTKSSRGTGSDTKVVSTKRVNNITELADEFAQFSGGDK
jgi:hypothetical protein